MAITYPLMMPTSGVLSVSFELMHNDAVNDTGAASYGTEIYPPYWDISIQTTTLQRDSLRYRQWRAFADNLRGSKKVGLFYDPESPRPINYLSGLPATKAGGGAFTGAGAISSFTNRYVVTITGLPVNFQFRAADYIEFADGDRHFLTRLAEDSLGNGSGIATVTTVSAIPLLFDTGSTYNIEKPVTEGILVDGGNAVSSRREIEGAPMSIHARSRVF